MFDKPARHEREALRKEDKQQARGPSERHYRDEHPARNLKTAEAE